MSAPKPEERYTAKQAVFWWAPRELFAAGVRATLAKTFGDYADRRETLAALTPHAIPPSSDEPLRGLSETSIAPTPAIMIFSEIESSPGSVWEEAIDHPQSMGTSGQSARGAATDYWFDYVADLGDGFAATYSVAELLARDTLTVDDHTLPRGQLLLMGGDQVYPTPSDEEYRNRTVGPYTTASLGIESEPRLYAIPGNHDWYDGLTAFINQFCTEQRMAAWKTLQYRSYFSVELPHGWWLWGIDAAFEARIDRPQMEYFREASNRLREGDRVILCTAKPTWLSCTVANNDEEYRILRNFITETGADVALMVAGDTHAYVRYEEPGGTHKIVAGGGGAYFSGSAAFPDGLRLRETRSAPPIDHTKAAVFPSPADSRKLYWSALWRLPRALGFVAALGVFAVFLAYLLQFAVVRRAGGALNDVIADVGGDGIWQAFLQVAGSGLTFVPFLAVVALMFAGAYALANKGAGGGRMGGVPFGAVHTTAQVLTAMFVTAVAIVAAAGLDPSWLWFFLVAAILGSLLTTLVFTLYLIVASLLGRNHNELFIGIRWSGYKNFLRFRIDSAGDLHVYALGLRHVDKRELTWDEHGNPKVSGQASTPTLIDTITLSGTPHGT